MHSSPPQPLHVARILVFLKPLMNPQHQHPESPFKGGGVCECERFDLIGTGALEPCAAHEKKVGASAFARESERDLQDGPRRCG